MSYTVLNSKLQTVAVGFQSLSAAAKDTIETKPQDRVWFVEDDSGDIVAIVHCESVWMPFTQAEIEAKDRQTMSDLKPSNYSSHPMSSVSREWEAEQIARNIMTILWRTGDEWRPLAWEEYQAERQKDGGFSESEKLYFDRVISYCKSAEDADRFCSSWRK